MTKKTINSHTPSSVRFDGFSKSAASILNFRLREDGALEKRCGARYLFDLGEKIRGFWSGRLYGRFSCYLLAGNTVYSADLTTATTTEIGTVSSTEGDANFFFLQGRLYLTDGGKNIYLIEKDSFRIASGYLPTLGKDWDTVKMGELLEPLNLINRRAHITYVVGDFFSILVRVPYPIESIDALYLNGELLPKERYSINNFYVSIEIAELKTGDRLEVYLTFEESEKMRNLLSMFCSTKGSVFFCNGEKSRTFFFDSEGSDTMFCTSYVSPEALTESIGFYDSDPLYLPEGYAFRVGDGTYPIRGAIRHHDSLLIFTEKDTWAANADSSGLSALPTIPVNAELGCIVSHGCVLSPNDPITISHHGLYRWESNDLEQTQHDAIRISQALDDILTPEDLRHATLFYHALTDELYLNLRSRGELWITSLGRDDWYCFTGITADRLFDADGKIGFTNGSQVFVMDPTLSYDLDAQNEAHPILASYESKPLDFDTAKFKNLSRFDVACELQGATLCVELLEDDKRSVQYELSDPEHPAYTVLSHRLRSGRFRHARLRLSSEDLSPLVIHEIALVAH